MPFFRLHNLGRAYNACLQILQARFQSDSIPFFLRFLSIYCRHKKKWTSCFFYQDAWQNPTKIFKCKKCTVYTYLYVFFKIIFLTENKLNLIKRLKFGRFSFFGLVFFVACRQSLFHCLQKVCFLLHEVLKHRQIPNWNLACKFCRHAL